MIADHFAMVQQALGALDLNAIEQAIGILRAAKERGSMVFIAGNGGSAATASHFACDLQKQCGIRAIALTDNVPLITAWANDRDYYLAYARQLDTLIGLGEECSKHVVVLLSCSGVSQNIGEIYHNFDNPIICLFGPIRINPINGLCVSVANADYGVIEDVHLSICHAITKALKDGR